MEMETEDCKWYEYKCKSGETLFFYNTVTGEHKWPNQGNCSVDDTESKKSEGRDPPLHQYNEHGMFVRSIGTQTVDTTAIEDVAGVNTTSIGSQTDATKTYNSIGTETDINGVSGSRRLRALFDCALFVCNAEKVCCDDSDRVRSVAQTQVENSGSCDICELHELDKARNEEMNMSTLQENVFKEQRPISNKTTGNEDKEDKMMKKELVDGQQMHLQKEIAEEVPQTSCGFNYDEPVSDDMNEPLNNEILDDHRDVDDLGILPCVSGTSFGGDVGKEKCGNDLIERKEPEVVVPRFLEDDLGSRPSERFDIVLPHCRDDELETHLSERFDNRGRQSESLGVTTICNSIKAESSYEMPAECESIPECFDNCVIVEKVHTFLGLEEKDENVRHLTVENVFPPELYANPAEEVSLDMQNVLSSVTNPENTVQGHVQGISGVPYCTDSLQHHEQSVSLGEGRFKCTYCEKSFKFRCHLVVHLRNHTGERPYKCTQCDMAFKMRHTLLEHLRIHTGERPYKCTQCGKTFRKRFNLTVHRRLHTGERPYKCTIQCSKAFKTRCELNSHLRTCQVEGSYKCTQCGKTFKKRAYLSLHLLFHTGERPFICTQCGKTFKKRFNLSVHLRIHTRERP